MQAIASDGLPIILIWTGEAVPGETHPFFQQERAGIASKHSQ